MGNRKRPGALQAVSFPENDARTGDPGQSFRGINMIWGVVGWDETMPETEEDAVVSLASAGLDYAPR